MANTWNQALTTWGQNQWGEQTQIDISLTTSFLATSSLGTLPYAGSIEGWGRDAWGDNEWGTNAHTVSLTGFEMTASLGPNTWGAALWGESTWGSNPFIITTTQLSIAAITDSLEITGSVGTPTYAFDMINFAFTGPAELGVGLGVLNINDGADHSQGVGSLLATASVGSLGHEMAYDLTGIQATGYLGSPTITQAVLVPISASLLATGSVGAITLDDMTIGLSGLQATGSVGAITPADMVLGLTGLSATLSLGSVSPLGYKDIDITGNTAYSNVDITGNTSYTDVTHAG